MLKKNNPIEKYQFIHHFVPHPYHKKRASFLSPKALISYIAMTLLLIVALKALPKIIPGVLGFASNIYVEDLYKKTNEVRLEQGLPALTYNLALSAAAQKKAEDMFKNDYWAHVSPTGTKPWDFIVAQDYDYEYAGENLAKNFNNSNDVVVAWYNSKSHRENLLSPNYDEIGFAVVDGVLEGYETTLVVQMFGKPRYPTYVADAVSQIPLAAPVTVASPIAIVPSTQAPASAQNIVASIDLTLVSRYILATFILFLISLMALDIWYSAKKSIPKFTGHTLAHVTFLIVILASVWFSLSPGRIL